MKKILAIIFFIVISMSALAQSCNNFLGIKIGMNKELAIQTLSSKYKIKEITEKYISLQGLFLGQVNYDGCYVYIEDGMVSAARFYILKTYADPFEKREAVTKEILNLYNRTYSQFKTKYGEPFYFTEGNVTWKDSDDYTITLYLDRVDTNPIIGNFYMQVDYSKGLVNDNF